MVNKRLSLDEMLKLAEKVDEWSLSDQTYCGSIGTTMIYLCPGSEHAFDGVGKLPERNIRVMSSHVLPPLELGDETSEIVNPFYDKASENYSQMRESREKVCFELARGLIE